MANKSLSDGIALKKRFARHGAASPRKFLLGSGDLSSRGPRTNSGRIGIKERCEVAVHTNCQWVDDDSDDLDKGVVFVDLTSEFNSADAAAVLSAGRSRFPSRATWADRCHMFSSRPSVWDCCISNARGMQQGDARDIAFFSLAILVQMLEMVRSANLL